jgi:hypothetical protein
LQSWSNPTSALANFADQQDSAIAGKQAPLGFLGSNLPLIDCG